MTGCGQNFEASGNPAIKLLPDYDAKAIGTCDNDPLAGDEVSLLDIDPSVSSSQYFGKRLQLDQLESSLSASSYSIALNLRLQGVHLYHVADNPSSQCRYFAFLPSPTEKAAESWRQYSGGGFSSLLGLFITLFSRNDGSGNVRLDNPTIMLRHNTQKWTLLHEMTHYLFAWTRAKQINMPFDRELLAEMKTIDSDIKQLESQLFFNAPAAAAQQLANKYRRLFELSYELDKRSYLEEFAIESMLLERADKGLINHITSELDARNALEYMKSNAARVTGDYERLSEKISTLSTNRLSQFSHSIRQPFVDLENDIQKLLNFIDNKVSQGDLIYSKLKGSNNTEMNALALRQVDSHESHMHSPHNIDENLLNQKHTIFDNL